VIGYDIINWLRDRTIVAPEIRLQRLKSKINVTILILGFTMLIVSILFHVNILRYASPIPFSDIDKITLKDFKGYRKPFETMDGESRFAFITTSIDLEKNDKTVIVQALFHPARSYVYNDKVINRFMLKHELYHFRITEIFARQCRMKLSESAKLPEDDAISKIIGEKQDLRNMMQQQYDYETYHGYLLKEQKRWENKVDSLLNLLDKYKTPTVVYE
jgi:hypothetical protein